MFDEIEALERSGHQVAHFATAHPCNLSSPWSDYFAPYVELGGPLAGPEAATAALRMFYNRSAAAAMRRLLDVFRPDVVHAHGIHRQLSPSILAAARTRGIPVVQTLHDFHHVCPADSLLRAGTDECLPPRCRAFYYWPAVRYRCHKGSAASSALSAAETCFQRVRRAYERSVARFISPSQIMANVMQASGWDTPVDVVRNSVSLPVATLYDEACRTNSLRSRGANRIIYAGRLSREKGLHVLADAASRAGIRVLVAGDGPMRPDLAGLASLELIGRLEPDDVLELMSSARAVVLPSTCLENAPISILEAMGLGVAVIASCVGGVPEMVEDGVEGLLVAPNDPEALAQAMLRVTASHEDATRMGGNGRQRVERSHTAQIHIAGVIDTYRRAGVTCA